ncbi:hypothetical protein SFR_5812 [Streptomyces sp. FR-008]|nr:hypothetical protein SFR_5812 [Streptomyces sp. FR-008]
MQHHVFAHARQRRTRWVRSDRQPDDRPAKRAPP